MQGVIPVGFSLYSMRSDNRSAVLLYASDLLRLDSMDLKIHPSSFLKKGLWENGQGQQTKCRTFQIIKKTSAKKICF